MKERASFTFDKETVEIIDKLIKEKGFRNKSHVVERAIQLLGKAELLDPIAKEVSDNKKGGKK